MRKKIFATAFAVSVFTAAVFAQTPMSRDDVLRHAFDNSETLAQLKSERERTELMRREHQGGAFPQISAGFTYVVMPNLNDATEFPSFSDMVQGMVGGIFADENAGANEMALAGASSALAGGIDGLFGISSINPTNALSWELNVAQVLFAQGKVRTALRIADIALEINDLRLESEKFELAQEVVNAYNGALMAQQNLRIQEEALAIALESHRIALARFNSGRGNVLDTLNTRLAHQQAVLRIREAEMGKRLALKNLTNVAALNDENIALSDTLNVPTFNMSEEEAWRKMQENNPRLRLLTATKRLQEEQTVMARTDYRPTVAAFIGIGQTNAFGGGDLTFREPGARWDARIGLNAQVPIWDGGRRRSRVAQAQHQEREVEMTVSQATRGLRLALTAAFEELAVAKEEFVQVEQMIVLATEGFRISRLMFEIGQSTQLELNNSEQQQRLTLLGLNGAVLRINTAIVNIEKLIGEKTLISTTN